MEADYIVWGIVEDTDTLERWVEFRIGLGDTEYVARTNNLLNVQTLARTVDDYLRFRTDGEDATELTLKQVLESLEPDVNAASHMFDDAKRDKQLVEEVVVAFCAERAFTWTQTKQVLALLLAAAKVMESEMTVLVGVPEDLTGYG
jgi:hypothetical protein